MPQLSHGTMFVWSAADAETRQAKALEIEPVHFLLGLTKLAELPEQARIDSDDEENDVLIEITAEAVELAIEKGSGLEPGVTTVGAICLNFSACKIQMTRPPYRIQSAPGFVRLEGTTAFPQPRVPTRRNHKAAR